MTQALPVSPLALETGRAQLQLLLLTLVVSEPRMYFSNPRSVLHHAIFAGNHPVSVNILPVIDPVTGTGMLDDSQANTRPGSPGPGVRLPS